MFDYVVSLREGIMDAWGGIIGAMKGAGKSKRISWRCDILLIHDSSTPARTC